jgi:hypothetical protein
MEALKVSDNLFDFTCAELLGNFMDPTGFCGSTGNRIGHAADGAQDSTP